MMNNRERVKEVLIILEDNQSNYLDSGTYCDRGVQTWAREMYRISDSRRELLGWVNPYEK